MPKKAKTVDQGYLKNLNLGNSKQIDAFIGQRLRRRRSALGISQTALADVLGLTFQQVQKYEKGASRISVGRLWNIGKILNVPITYFFDGFEGKNFSTATIPCTPVLSDNNDEFTFDPMAKRDTRELLRAYYTINPRTAKNILRIMKDIANMEKGAGVSFSDDEGAKTSVDEKTSSEAQVLGNKEERDAFGNVTYTL